MMRYVMAVSAILILITACTKKVQQDKFSSEVSATPSGPADLAIDQAIQAHGGLENYENVSVAFEFRNRTYKAARKNGLFQYERLFADSTGDVRDIVRNDGFVREVNGLEAVVHDSMKVKYTGSVSSVIYFALQPFPLKDPAVIPTYLGEVELEGRKQHKIEVRFRQEGGGPEFEDVFMYWIDVEEGYVNYLAYLYHTEGGGIRFRKGYNFRVLDGIRYADYVNYKAEYGKVKLGDLDTLFEAGELEELSRIETENVRSIDDLDF